MYRFYTEVELLKTNKNPIKPVITIIKNEINKNFLTIFF